MNSREKGKRGERQWRDELRAQGFMARRGQQFAGGAESPDVVCESLPWVHFEVKAVERLNIEEAMAQARRDCAMQKAECRVQNRGQRIPVVAHKRNNRAWLVTMEAETFFRLVRGDLGPGDRDQETGDRRQGAEDRGQETGIGDQQTRVRGQEPGNAEQDAILRYGRLKICATGAEAGKDRYGDDVEVVPTRKKQRSDEKEEFRGAVDASRGVKNQEQRKVEESV